METDLHVKPTSKHQYLYTKSCHLKHCKTAIPYTQALRITRICSEWENLLLRTNQLKHHLSKRGYSDQLLDSEINRAINTSYGSSSSRSNRRNSNRVPLVVTYRRNLPKLKRTIRRYTTFYSTWIGFKRHFHLGPSLLSSDSETYAIYWYAPILLPKSVIPSATIAAKLVGARPAPYWLPPTRSPAA